MTVTVGRAVQIGGEVLANFVLPYVIYVLTSDRLGQVHALMVASLPPIVWSGVEFARHRRIDAVSMLVIGGIVLSLLAFLGGGSVRLLQLRENLANGVVALAFLGSAAIGRPLIYLLARATLRRTSHAQAAAFEEGRADARFRRAMMVMTVVWGAGLLVQAVIACVLVFSMPIARYLIVSPFVGYGAMGALGLWTVWYARGGRPGALPLDPAGAEGPRPPSRE